MGALLASHLFMKETRLTIPEMGLIAGTRVALGAGIGFLLSERFSKDQRRGAGWALLGIGVLSSIPLVFEVISKTTVPEKPIQLAV